MTTPNFFDFDTMKKTWNMDGWGTAQQKSFESCAKTCSTMADCWNTLATRQTAWAQECMEDSITTMKELSGAKGMDEFVTKQSTAFQKCLDKCTKNSQEIAKTQQKMIEMMNGQMADTIKTFQSQCKTTGTTTK